MKNKLIIPFILCLLFTIASCQSEELQTPSIELAKDTWIYPQTAAQVTIPVKATGEWIVTKLQVDWCKATPSGNQLQLELTENEGKESRATDITLTAGAVSVILHVQQLGQEPDILVGVQRIDLQHRDTLIAMDVVSNVAYEVMIPDTIDWIVPVPQTRGMVTYSEEFRVLTNAGEQPRSTYIYFKSEQEGIERKVMIRQLNRDKTYNPGTPGEVGNIKIPVSSGKASQEHPGEGIERSFDEDPTTFYHSPYSGAGTTFPVTLDYHFKTAQAIDYIVYMPRTDSENGRFGAFDIYVLTEQLPDYQLVGSYDAKEQGMPTKIEFTESKTDVKSVRFVVKSGKNNFVTCNEMEFYRKRAPIVGLSEVFADDLCSELKPDISQKQIDGIEDLFFRSIAQSMFDKTYNTEYRIQLYDPYQDRDELAQQMKTSGYCPFENATGIYFKAGQEVVVMVGPTYGERVQLKVFDFDKVRSIEKPSVSEQLYLLEQGINKIKITGDGLAYINYFTPNWKQAQRVKIHIPSGTVNGYFDKARHTSADWKKILSNASYGCLDMKGTYINLVYGVESLKKYCTDASKLLDKYDEITTIEHDLMGLIKYNKRPKNHMFARVVFSGLFADGWGAGFAEGVMDELADENKAGKEGVWCIAHELGHVNQIRPGLKWVSTSEVTNNVYSVYARYKLNRDDLNLEQERVNDGDGNNVLGGRFNSYLNYGIVKGEQWLCQKGQDKLTEYENGGDHFVKLCPLWQLMLYYREIVGHRDWYGDVAERVRNMDDSKLSNGELQLNFMRNTCDVVKEDVTDFFIKAGMLKPIDKELDDYSRGQMTITQQQCDDLVKYASRYPKPATPVLYYLTANSEKAYKERLAVEGVFNQGIKVKNGNVYVEHQTWKNVAVFETYQGTELIKVAMVGTDSKDLSSTLVRYPQGSTRIEAVAWDGKRTLVYGARQ